MSASTIKDIARETGLSPATISKYLNGGNVRPDNRAAIQAAIEKLDYHPNEAARNVRGVSRRVIAIVIPTVTADYCRVLFLMCQQLLLKQNYSVLLINYNNDPEHEQTAVSGALNNSVTGIISLPMNPDAECYQRAKKLGTPLLFIYSSELPDAHNIVLNDHNSIAEVVSGLCEAGHSRIGMISGMTEKHVSNFRIEVFKTLLRSHNCPLSEELLYISSGPRLDIGYEGLEYMISLNNPPTAVICLNSELLLGAKLAALEHKLRIPADLSIAGITESRMTESAVLRNITSISYPVSAAAEEAVRVILKSIEDKRNNLPVEYITTGFCADTHWGGSIATLA